MPLPHSMTVEIMQTVGFSIEYLKRQKLGIVEHLIARKASP